MKLKIKKGDTVIILSGNSKGKTGTVLSAFPKAGKVLVEGINVVKRHERKRRDTGKGQIVEKALPIGVSKVALYDAKVKKGTRKKAVAEKPKKKAVKKSA